MKLGFSVRLQSKVVFQHRPAGFCGAVACEKRQALRTMEVEIRSRCWPSQQAFPAYSSLEHIDFYPKPETEQHIYAATYIRTYSHAYISSFIHPCMNVRMHGILCVYIYICYIYTHMFAFMHVCMYVCVYASIYVCTYIYI